MSLQLTYLKEVESTNNYAMGVVKAGLAAHGMAWHAGMQTRGKGQHGKAWLTKPGENISLSVVVDTKRFTLTAQFRVSMLAALAGHRFFAALAGDETTIKWPNDIYWRDRKAAGILIENHVAAGRWDYSVIGIGVNINQKHFDPGVKNPVSLLQITGRTYDTQHLASELASVILQLFDDCPGDEALLQQYNAVLYKRNEPIRLKREAAHFTCRLKGVNLLGEIEVEGAAQETYSHAEAQLVL